MVKTVQPVILVILDGWGMREDQAGNAIAAARLRHFPALWAKYPHTLLEASGEAVGLPAGQMGNSEVGHLNMGAGRVVYQDLTRITRSIRDRSFFQNPELVKAMELVRDSGSKLHLMGLLSDGGVHSHIQHLFALLEMAREAGLDRVYVHAFLDGRDVPPANAHTYIRELEEYCHRLGTGRIATIMGRYYAMDRDRRWERTQKAYLAMVAGEGEGAVSATAALDRSYELDITDEFMLPAVVQNPDGTPVATVEKGDAVIFFNFRADRARQITRAFVEPDFRGFRRSGGQPDIHFVCLTTYDVTIPAPVAFPPQELRNTLGEVIASHGMRQLRVAETEKYAHVTFFFNGGVEEANDGEDRLLIPSPKVATYDLQPEMSAREVTEAVVDRIRQRVYDLIILNYANPDMVGHTGVMEAAVAAVETVDECLGRVVAAGRDAGYTLIITADHGNVEQMVDEQGEPQTAHTSGPVPFILVNGEAGELVEGNLADVAPTVLDLMGLDKPPEMTGHSLWRP